MSNYALLLIFAEQVDDFERMRIATENRARALEEYIVGTPEHDRLIVVADQLRELEHQASLSLVRAVRAHPAGPWVKGTVGLGEKQVGRLLAAIGDPAERPNVAKLWAYCGYHVIDGRRPQRRRGQRCNWNTTAKTRAWLCAKSCIQHRTSPYRPAYDEARQAWADRDTTDLHKHNHALSIVAKEILKDLWVESRRLAAEAA